MIVLLRVVFIMNAWENRTWKLCRSRKIAFLNIYFRDFFSRSISDDWHSRGSIRCVSEFSGILFEKRLDFFYFGIEMVYVSEKLLKVNFVSISNISGSLFMIAHTRIYEIE